MSLGMKKKTKQMEMGKSLQFMWHTQLCQECVSSENSSFPGQIVPLPVGTDAEHLQTKFHSSANTLCQRQIALLLNQNWSIGLIYIFMRQWFKVEHLIFSILPPKSNLHFYLFVFKSRSYFISGQPGSHYVWGSASVQSLQCLQIRVFWLLCLAKFAIIILRDS